MIPIPAGVRVWIATGAASATGMKARSGEISAPVPLSLSSRRQRNNRLAAMPCLRATEDTDALAVSPTIACFSESDHLRRVSATTTKCLSEVCPDIGTA